MSLKAESDKKITSIYFKNLDALRFLAAFSVIIFHFSRDIVGIYPGLLEYRLYNIFDKIAVKGHLGVNFFFVLSGFLITYLILHEKKSTNQFLLWKFLLRRTLRIWPLYFIIVIIGFIVLPLLLDGYHTNHNPWMYVGFLANFDEIINGANDPVNFLTSPWSVAVEEQFYLFWGIALFIGFKLSRFKAIHLIILLYLVSFLFRWYYWDDARVLYYNTITVCQDILTGTLIGVALFQGNLLLEKIKNIPKIGVVIIYVLGFGLCILKNKIFPGQLIIFERSILSIFFGYIILDQIRGEHSFIKFGNIKPFNFLGKISYGLYMYHLLIMYLIWYTLDTIPYVAGYWIVPLYFVLIIVLVVGVATCSYYLIERPFLKLKSKLR